MRNDKDFYVTPRSTINALFGNYDIKTGWVLEPCAGNGSICKALRENPKWDGSLYAVEIREEEQYILSDYCDDVLIADFLQADLNNFAYPMPCPPKTIITNPPFSIAEEVIEKCFEIADDQTEIIMLLRLGFLEAVKRKTFWGKHPNVSLITLSNRPSFTGNGTDNSAYGWYIWNNERQFIKPCVSA